MGKHRKAHLTRWSPYLTTGIALEVATLFTFAYATDAHVMPNPLLVATTTVFVDGTKSLTGNEKGISPYRMVDSLQGTYAQANPDDDRFVTYPRSLGPLTGAGDPTYDDSERDATTKTVQAVKDARIANPDDTIVVVGYSQGAGAVSEAMKQLETDGVDTSNVDFVLAANPRRNDGGILTRLPAGVYVPVIGVTFGGGTTPQASHVLQITKQYDGVADAPKYVINVVADVNAAMGFYYLHPGYYETVDPSAVPADDRIVSTSADGRITDVLVKAPVGGLPLTMPLLQLGVPRPVVEALDPFLRAVIETGYDRPSGPGSYPTQPVPFQFTPPPATWVSDVQSVAAGAVQTTQAATAVAQPTEPDPQALAKKSTPTPVIASTSSSPGATASPNKVTPVRHPTGGWKPGDLLRSVLRPFTGGGSSATDTTTSPATTPEPASAPAAESGTPSAEGSTSTS
ncbi:PE-PPE domain-containing protein [Mycolicibacterium sp.]|uniref:PE-PPE domain-containing protein n=1 Tax=Mycolicibacterium sp. TaxID=2320850 RepID=UPI001A35E53F|nr:PE-PPE domain-containing protein [Mycolicibacterium sp.]MBJ7340661.1 PE-PPE domain-containing protein [Mycolicibacterium sp.]